MSERAAVVRQNRSYGVRDGRRERAAFLSAEDVLSDVDIAKEVGVQRSTLQRWKAEPAFIARVEEHRAALAAATVAQGIADRRNRVDALNDRWHRLRTIIDARAADATYAAVPGGDTGLLVHRIKVAGIGPAMQLVDEYEVDTDLLRELRAHEEQAARELGQWTERQQTLSAVVIREYVGVSVDEV